MNNPHITIERRRVDPTSGNFTKGFNEREMLRGSGGGRHHHQHANSGSSRSSSAAAGATPLTTTTQQQQPTVKSEEMKIEKSFLQVHPPLVDHQMNAGSSSILPQPSISIHRTNLLGGSMSHTASLTLGGLKRRSHNLNLSISTSSSPAPAKLPCSQVTASNPTSTITRPSTTQSRHHVDFSRPYTDISLVPPIRQTASIFKQPVTVINNHENGKVKHDQKNGNQEKPKQLFWEKRLEGLHACSINGEEFKKIPLPRAIKSVGPNVNEQTVLQSIATALHVSNQPVLGQTASKDNLCTNSGAFINPEQPLMHSVKISEDDIRIQEDKVNKARKKLQNLLND